MGTGFLPRLLYLLSATTLVSVILLALSFIYGIGNTHSKTDECIGMLSVVGPILTFD